MKIEPLSVRRCTFIEANPESVWTHFETFDSLAVWFSIGHTLDEFIPGPDGKMLLHVELDSGQKGFGGNTCVWEPGKRFSITDNWFDDDMAWPCDLYISFILTESGTGTLVELVHHGFEALGQQAAAQHEMYEAGWNNQHLQALKKIVEAS